jgi:hypothetical protein
MEPLRVYLDSSDFSTLSNPRRTPELSLLRDCLVEFAEAGKVQFLFSAAHLMEMAPLEATYTAAAANRADLLVELCGRNALISIDRLIDAELDKLSCRTSWPVQAISTRGEWYPNWGNLISPVQWADAIKEVDYTSRQHGLNRHQRRQLKGKLFKDGKPKTLARRIVSGDETGNVNKELLERYPMRPQDFEVLLRYVGGKATKNEANEAFLESLRDPSWMMRWFSQHHTTLSPFIDWIRDSGRTFLDLSENVAKMAESALLQSRELNSKFTPDLLTPVGWLKFQEEMLLSVVKRLLIKQQAEITTFINAADIDEHCRGISTFIRTMHSTLRDVISETPRQPKRSDLPDGLHAMYSPYVSIFRTDSYMAGHVRRHAARYGTEVVAKLNQLVPTIESRLQSV